MDQRSPPGARRRPTRPPPKCMPPPSRAGRNCSAGSISRPAAPPRWCVCASSDGRHGPSRRPRRGRRRFRPSVLVLVQPRLPGAAAHRLVDAGHRAGKDHPLRGRTRDPATGTICAAASIRPTGAAIAFFHPALVDEPLIFVEVALTREIPAAIAPILAQGARGDGARQGAHRDVLFDLQLPARPGRRLLRQFPDQAGGRGDFSREMPKLSTFVTLSPVTNFADWLARERSERIGRADRGRQGRACRARPPGWWHNAEMAESCAIR